LQRAGIALLALAITLGAIEIGMRITGAGDPSQGRGRRSYVGPAEHPDLDYAPRPGARATAGHVRVSINSHGFRDREYERARTPGVARIAVLGDSIAFGSGLPLQETFPKQLEALLAEAGRSTEVLNLGVFGYDVVDEVAFFEQVGAGFQPDLVILGFCINDVGIHSANSRGLGWGQDLEGLGKHSRLARWLLQRRERTLLMQDFHRLNQDDEFSRQYAGSIDSLEGDPEQRSRLADLRAALDAAAAPVPFAEWYASEAKIGRLRHAFARLAELAAKGGFEVLVALIPYLDEQGHQDLYGRAYEIAALEARRAGFEVLSLRDSFSARGAAELRLERAGRPDPLHPNAEGHRLIAEELLSALDPPRS